MHIFENEITLGNRPILDEYMNSYEYKTSGLSFSSMYMWRNINLFQWDIIGDYMCVTGLSHLELGRRDLAAVSVSASHQDGNI